MESRRKTDFVVLNIGIHIGRVESHGSSTDRLGYLSFSLAITSFVTCSSVVNLYEISVHRLSRWKIDGKWRRIFSPNFSPIFSCFTLRGLASVQMLCLSDHSTTESLQVEA